MYSDENLYRRPFRYVTLIPNDEVTGSFHQGIYYDLGKVRAELSHIMKWDRAQVRDYIKNNFRTGYFKVLDYCTLVKYGDEHYWVEGYVLPYEHSIDTGILYKLRKRKGTKGKRNCLNNHQPQVICSEMEFIVCEHYWFINSKGEIHRTFLNINPDADEWRKLVGNYFTDKETAKAYKDKILCG